jgi:hypothetical protein
MDAFNSLGAVLDDYQKNGVRVTVEVSSTEYIKLGTFVALTAIAVILAYLLLKGIFSSN